MAGDRYTHGHDTAVLEAHRRRTAENSAAFLLPHQRAGMAIVDVGCGPGTITCDLAALVAPGDVIGVDRAAAALDAANAEARRRGLDNVRFVNGDAHRLPLGAASADVVFAHQVLQHLADPVAALLEMARVARAGGIVAARDADYAAMSWYPAEPGLDRWRELYRTVARANGGEPDAARHLPAWARRAGFGDIEYSASTWWFVTAAERACWGELWSERVAGPTFARQALELGLADEGELASIAEAWRRWAADPDGWFVVVHGELLART